MKRAWQRVFQLAPAALLILALTAQAATSSVRLHDESPLLGATPLLYANVGLAGIALAQLAYHLHRRRAKYRLVPAPPPPPGLAQGIVEARVLRCGACAAALRIASSPGGRYRCPTCRAIGVVP